MIVSRVTNFKVVSSTRTSELVVKVCCDMQNRQPGDAEQYELGRSILDLILIMLSWLEFVRSVAANETLTYRRYLPPIARTE